jgi:hypothetical protein
LSTRKADHPHTAVIAADRASAAYDIEHTPQKKQAVEREREREALLESNKTVTQRAKEWATENRYPLLFGFWVASMAGSWTLVNRNRYLSGSQKLVQARMYAQGATLAALMTSFALEGADAAKGQGRWETIKVLDPNDPEHKHLIEKRVHHESYPGEDQWRGMSKSVITRISGLQGTIVAGYPDQVFCHGSGRTFIMHPRKLHG